MRKNEFGVTVDFRKADFAGMIRIERTVDDVAEVSSREVAEYIVRDIRSSWTPGISSPGEPPAVQTGNLDSAVKTEAQGRTGLGRFAGKDAKIYFVRISTAEGNDPRGRGEYAGILEGKLNRPFMSPAVDRAEAALGVIFKRNLRRAMRP